MINFYRSHLAKAAYYMQILNNYLHNAKRKDKSKIVWTEDAEKAFEKCKNELRHQTTPLAHPDSDNPLVPT